MLLRRHGISIHRNQPHPIPDPRSNMPCCNASGMTEKLQTQKLSSRTWSGIQIAKAAFITGCRIKSGMTC